ncbi:MAG: AI-2E family transporter [Bacteroidales bacterium]|jgi:predicted PurR-regulated permease PerM|nr:AI-2E family transporter [Bacteroidales bacterium]
MNKNKYRIPPLARWIISIIIISLAIYGLWYFRFLVICLAFSIVLSFVGRPIMNLLSKIHYKKIHFGNTLSSSITLVILIAIIFFLFYLLIPLIVSQATNFANIDIYQIADYYQEPIKNFENFLYEYQLLAPQTHLETLISNKILSMFQMFQINDLASMIISFGTNIVMGLFIIIFITFFLLKDSYLLYNFVMGITPDRHLKKLEHIICNTRRLISRYFIGIFIEILAMIALLTIGFSIVGFKNALLIAFIGGVMVIIPYIGVIIGGAMGLIICITSFLSIDPSMDILPIIIKFLCVFGGVKLLDDFILQPIIYSKSVKAHPLEIFLVIIMAGQVGGVIGMILAIPAYTFIRIIAKEFFSQWKIVQKFTKNI